MPDLNATEWMEEIDNALEYRRQFGMEDAWKQMELDYTNDPSGHTSVGPNLIYSMGDSLLSSLTVPDPEFLLSPEHLNGVDRAPVVEAVDNWLVRKLKLKREVERAILSSYLFSRAIMKIGYDSEFGWSPYFDIGTGNNMMGMTLTQFDKKGKRIEFGSASPGMPWVASVLPHDFVVPWGTTHIDNAPWCAHRIIRLTEHIKKDAKYKNTSHLEPDMTMEGFIESYGHVMAKNKRSMYKNSGSHATNTKPLFTELWEIHDKMDGKIKVVTRDSDKFLRNGIDALQLNGELPFVSATLVPHPRTFWGTPQAYYLGQMQATEYDISIQAEKTRRINNLKFLVSKGVMDTDQMNILISGDVGAIGEIDTSQPIRDTVVAFPQGNNIDFVIQSQANRGNARDAIGFSNNQLGEFEGGRHTAREATFVQSGSQTRTSRRMNAIVGLYIDTIKKVNNVIFRYWKIPRYMMVGNEQVKFTGEELEGDYLYDITLSTKRNVSASQRKMESIQLMMMLSQIPGANIDAMKQYISDASGDPAFETLLGVAKQNALPKQGQGGGLPTIPATGV